MRTIRMLQERASWDELFRSCTQGDASLYSSSNYVTVAALSGLISRVFWVIPEPLLEYSDAENRVRMMLADSSFRFKKEEIDAMKWDRGCITGKLSGIGVSICNMNTLPALVEPVRFGMEVDFIGKYAQARQCPALLATKEILDALTVRKLRVVDAEVILTGTDSRSLHRYRGDTVLEMLRNPKILQSGPPPAWTARDDIDWRFSQGQNVTKEVRLALRKFPGDSTLRMFKAISQADAGNDAGALLSFDSLCRDSTDACFGLLFTAARLGKLRPGAAERYLRQAVLMKPDWPAALLAYGDYLLGKKEYAAALSLYERLSAVADGFSVQLVLGDCCSFLGRFGDALQHYRRALSFYDHSGRRLTARDRDALERFRKLCEQNGDKQGAQAINELLTGT